VARDECVGGNSAAVMFNIVTWRDDNGCQGGLTLRDGCGRRVFPSPCGERIEGEGPNSARGYRRRVARLIPRAAQDSALRFLSSCHSRALRLRSGQAPRRIPVLIFPRPVRERIEEPALSLPKGEGPCFGARFFSRAT
jgi:hypothetical protein